MNEPKFTNGPWKAEDTPSAGLQIKAAIPDGPALRHPEFTMKPAPHMQPIMIAPWTQFPNKEWDEMQLANFCLAAAAPEMYAACMIGHEHETDAMACGELLAISNMLRNQGYADHADWCEAKHEAERLAAKKARGES